MKIVIAFLAGQLAMVLLFIATLLVWGRQRPTPTVMHVHDADSTKTLDELARQMRLQQYSPIPRGWGLS